LFGQIQEQLKNAGYDTERLLLGKKLVLITGHRRENFGDGFINICVAIKSLTKKYPEVDFVYPMHLNPNVRKPIIEIFGEEVVMGKKMRERNIFFIEPLDYLPFVFLMELSTWSLPTAEESRKKLQD
jgi:UDP-N-acetylglucosamine 2-epimerase (non-hydrolysing)